MIHVAPRACFYGPIKNKFGLLSVAEFLGATSKSCTITISLCDRGLNIDAISSSLAFDSMPEERSYDGHNRLRGSQVCLAKLDSDW